MSQPLGNDVSAKGGMPRRLKWMLAGSIGLGFFLTTILAQSPSEYELKAAVIYHFNKYIEWPAIGLDTNAPIITGILGKDPFGPVIDQLFQRAKPIGGRNLQVMRITDLTQLRQCQVLFISSSEKSRFPDILKALDKAPTVTISEIDGFCASGGMIHLRMVDNMVRFEINVPAGERTGLRFSSKLIRQAVNASSLK
jgi:hypothetical protein